MKNLLAVFLLLCSWGVMGQTLREIKLNCGYEELTAPDFIKAVEKSAGVCLLPMGILEKHGPHLPLGTDIFECRKIIERNIFLHPVHNFCEINTGRIFLKDRS